jgi:hypothetical protein
LSGAGTKWIMSDPSGNDELRFPTRGTQRAAARPATRQGEEGDRRPGRRGWQARARAVVMARETDG